MKDALGRATVTLWVMEHALLDSERIDDLRREVVAFGGEREGACHSMAVEDERIIWQMRYLAWVEIAEIICEEVLHSMVAGRKVVCEEARFFLIASE